MMESCYQCLLQPIDKYPFQHNEEDLSMRLSYICFVDKLGARKLQIITHGFRYISSSYLKKMVFIIVDDSLEQIYGAPHLKAPFNIYGPFKRNRQFSFLISRQQPIQLINSILPKLQVASQVYIYVHPSFQLDSALIQFITQTDFIIENGEYYIDCQWLSGSVRKMRSLKQQTQWMGAIQRAKRQNRIRYLRIYVQSSSREGFSWLFKKGQTKLVVKKDYLHSYNIYQTVKVNNIEQSLFYLPIYYEKIPTIFNQANKNEIIILETDKDMNIQKFLHFNTTSQLKKDYRAIDCNYLCSTKQFWQQLNNISHLNSAIIFINNLPWIQQLYQSEQILDYEIKHIVKEIQRVFQQICQGTLKNYTLIIENLSEKSIAQELKNAKVVNMKMSKEIKKQAFHRVFKHYQSQSTLKQEIINQFYDKFGWAKLESFLQNNWQKIKNDPKEKIMKKIGEMVKQQQVQNLIQVSWDDVGGLQTAKEEIIQTVLLPIKHPQIFDQWIKPRTGLLFYGPPGTGKTLLGKCVAKECKMNFISVKGPQLLNMYVGQSEKNVRAVFQRARACSPCIVFMDQLDALVPKRGNSGDSNQVMDRIVAQLLQQMDIAPLHQVFIIGATNRPDLLDPSILRPGRFDKQIYLGITQSKEDRIKIIKAQTRHLNLQQNLNWTRVIEILPRNFTGADFYGLTSKAVMAAAERTIEQYQQGQNKEKIQIKQQDFIKAASQVKPSVTQSDLLRYQTLKQIYS